MNTCRVKISVSPGFIVRNRDSGTLTYFHSSTNNHQLFDSPRLCRTEQDVRNLISDIQTMDLNEVVRLWRPSTNYDVVDITNLTFYINKLVPYGKIGSPTTVPPHVKHSKSVLTMERDANNKTYTDNLCVFRCIAVALNCICTTGENFLSLVRFLSLNHYYCNTI